MSKKLKIYQVLTFTLGIAFAVLCAYMGITAIQKSMKLKIGFEVKPSFECRIDYGGNTIFCNSTKDPNGTFVGNGFTLDGNTLSFNQSFEGIGKTFVLTIYNYSDVPIKISVSGTNASGGPLTLAAYENSAPSGELTLVTAGASQAVLTFEEYVPPYTIGTYGTDADADVILGTDTIVTETGYSGYKYIEFNEVKSWKNDEGHTVPLRWVIIGAGINQKELLPSGAANKSANPDNLGADEILVISEQCLEYNQYDGSYANWSTSNIRTRIKSYTEAGGFMADLKKYMIPKALTTAWCDPEKPFATKNSTTANDPDHMFLLAHEYDSVEPWSIQDFLIQNYLGDTGCDLYKARYVGFSNNCDYWWLRSGYRSDYSSVYFVDYGGFVDNHNVNSSNGAVRPSFVLDLNLLNC